MRSFHPFKNSHEGYDALSPVEVQVSVYLFNLHNCSFRDPLITSSNCCFLNSTLGIFSSVPFLWISGISAIYLKLQDHVHLLFLVPFSSTSLMHYWVLLRDMIPVLKSLWHFYCAHLILHTLQENYVPWVQSQNPVILEYIFTINREKANTVIANSIMRYENNILSSGRRDGENT